MDVSIICTDASWAAASASMMLPQNASPPPTNEAVVAGGVRTKHVGHITPRCSRAQDPEDATEDTTVIHPRNAKRLVLQHGFDGNPFMIGEFIAHDSSPQFGSLNHSDLVCRNAWRQAPVGRLRAEADFSSPTIPIEIVDPMQKSLNQSLPAIVRRHFTRLCP